MEYYLSRSTLKLLVFMYLIYMVILFFVVALIMLFFERKIRTIEKTTNVIMYKVDALIRQNEFSYPHWELLPEKAIALFNDDRRAEACLLVMKKYLCTYEEAESSLSQWRDNDGSRCLK